MAVSIQPGTKSHLPRVAEFPQNGLWPWSVGPLEENFNLKLNIAQRLITTDREMEIVHMKQDVSGAINELQRQATFVLEIIFELKAHLLRLHILEEELEEHA